MTGPLVVVTGASGFLGRHVCDALRAAGAAVRPVVRRHAGAPHDPAAAVVDGLADRDGLRRAMQGADAVVHLAGRAHILRRDSDGDAFRRVNVDGTAAVLDASREAGVRRFLFMSSVAALCTSAETPATDDTPPAPDTPYGASKLAAERLVMAERDMAPLVVRPPMLYGPGMKGNPLRLFEEVARGTPLPLGRIRNARSMAYVGNLADAVRHAVVTTPALTGVYLVHDGWNVSSAEFAAAAATALGAPSRIWPVPMGALRLAALVGDVVSRAMTFPLTSDTLTRMGGSLVVDGSRFRRDAGWTPPVAPGDALRRTAEWFATRRADAEVME